MNDFAKEIEQMNRTLDVSANVEEFLTDPPSTEAPSTEEPVDLDSLVTEAPSTEAPYDDDEFETDSPSTESPSTEAPVEDDRDRRIAELEAKLAEKEKATTKAPSTSPPIEVGEQDFIGDLDIDEVTNDPKEFNKLLNKIYQKAVKDTEKVMGERFDKTIPNMVKENLTTMTSLQKASDEFFAKNEDLVPFRKAVAEVFEDLATKNPNESYGVIMDKVAVESRKRLGLNKKKPTQNKEEKKPPRPPRKKSRPGRGEEPKQTDPIQSELEEMNKTLRR